jgi:diguanylate cyclase (GGDEF)-like protein
MTKDSMPLETFSGTCASDVSCLYKDLIEQLKIEVETLKEQAHTDALTGLYNYRFFADILPREMERAQRSLQPMSMIIIDIDYFKKLNDQWGHEIGNKALIHIAKLIHQTIRKLDFACRFGGEEFAVILPNTDLRQSIYVANRIREVIEMTALQVDAQSINITASLGVDEYRANHSDTTDSFVERVDAWLYQAKHSGRNKVMHPDLQLEVIVGTNVTVDEKDALFNAFSDKES